MIRALLALCVMLAGTSAQAGELAAGGKLNVAIVPNYPPLDVRDPATNALTGFDVDLGEALAKRLGLTLIWQETSFEQMVSALATGRVDAILSGMTDLATRHETVTFVDYLRSGPQFFIQASRRAELPDVMALCGKSVGSSRRTSFPAEIAKWSEAHCAPAGKPAIVTVGTEGSADARTQLKQGRIDAAVQGNETLPYVMTQEPGRYVPLGEPIGSQLTGLGIAKANTKLQEAMAGALGDLIADGSYAKLLAKWQLSANAIDKVTINAGQ